MEATPPEGFKPLFRSSPFLDHNGPFFNKTNDDGTFVVGLRIEPKHANETICVRRTKTHLTSPALTRGSPSSPPLRGRRGRLRRVVLLGA